MVGMDYITGLPADNDGNTAAVSLAVASRAEGKSVAWYHPVKTHTGDDAIAAFIECEFRLSQMFPPGEFKIARVHCDCEPSLIGPLAAYLKSRQIWPTKTEGYDHNGAAVIENRNRTTMKGLRATLYTTTGGRSRYTEAWGTALVCLNDCVNHTSYAGEPTPVQNCGGTHVDIESSDSGVYGASVKFYRPMERRDSKLDSAGAIGIYAGRSHDVPGGHRVIELEWNHNLKKFDMLPTVDVKTIRIDNTKYPLSTLPLSSAPTTASLDDFVSMFDPRTTKSDVYEVYRILDHKLIKIPGQKHAQIEYLVHWKGYGKANATWEPEHNLVNCGAVRFVQKYRLIHVPKVFHTTAVDHDYLATHELMQRHRLDQPFDKCLQSYKLELEAVTRLRLRELHGDEREHVLKKEKAPRLRMNPEPKDDGRLKMRFLVMGNREPKEWTEHMSLDSPTPAASSLKMMMAMSDETDAEEELSVGDVATAFLKGDAYGPSERPRYVVYCAYRGARLRVFQLKGSLYGQRDAPVRWFKTFSGWLVSQGFVQCKNDVCLFKHPVTRVKVLLWVDDNLARGERKHTDAFWTAVDKRFGLKSYSYLELGVSRTFIGVSLLKSVLDGERVYCR